MFGMDMAVLSIFGLGMVYSYKLEGNWKDLYDNIREGTNKKVVAGRRSAATIRRRRNWKASLR